MIKLCPLRPPIGMCFAVSYQSFRAVAEAVPPERCYRQIKTPVSAQAYRLALSLGSVAIYKW